MRQNSQELHSCNLITMSNSLTALLALARHSYLLQLPCQPIPGTIPLQYPGTSVAILDTSAVPLMKSTLPGSSQVTGLGQHNARKRQGDLGWWWCSPRESRRVPWPLTCRGGVQVLCHAKKGLTGFSFAFQGFSLSREMLAGTGIAGGPDPWGVGPKSGWHGTCSSFYFLEVSMCPDGPFTTGAKRPSTSRGELPDTPK